MKPRPIPLEQHRKIGVKLFEFNDYMKWLLCEVGGHYGSSHRNTKLIERILKDLRVLRSEMEARMYADLGPDDPKPRTPESEALVSVYYPQPSVPLQ